MNDKLFEQDTKGPYITYVTEFLKHINDGIMVYWDKLGQCYTDRGECENEASMMDDIDGVDPYELLEQAIGRFGCSMVGTEIQGKSLAQVLQTEIWFFAKLEDLK